MNSPASRPFVSVIIPCRNENRFIGECVESVLANDYPPDSIEILVVDGMSRDGSRETVLELASRYARVRLVDNAKLVTPSAFNAGIRNAGGEIIAILGAHSYVEPDYVSKCVRALEDTGADNVGGTLKMVPRDDGVLARAITFALSHPFGVGNAGFRMQSREVREVDTVFGGCYRSSVFRRVGVFNEKLARSQDIEFNLRLRAWGGRILLVPGIVCHYRARTGYGAFLRHNLSNGYWAIVPFLHSPIVPVSWRHLVPLAFVSGLAGLAAAAVAWPPAGLILAAAAAAYVAGALASGVQVAARSRDWRQAFLMPFVFLSLHASYGLGSLAGLIRLAAGLVLDRSSPARYTVVKRVFDVCVAGTGLVLFSPVLLVAAAAIRISSAGPVLYRGPRVGRFGRRFHMLKFRTMVKDADKVGGSSTGDDDPRITPVGVFLRRWKLDELPQLFNVFGGSMSLVGPRPQVSEDVAKYTEEEREILTVKPGITDFASIKFHNEGEILKGHSDPDRAYVELIRPEKLRLCLEYVRRRSLAVDFRVLLMTLRRLAGLRVDLP